MLHQKKSEKPVNKQQNYDPWNYQYCLRFGGGNLENREPTWTWFFFFFIPTNTTCCLCNTQAAEQELERAEVDVDKSTQFWWVVNQSCIVLIVVNNIQKKNVTLFKVVEFKMKAIPTSQVIFVFCLFFDLKFNMTIVCGWMK